MIQLLLCYKTQSSSVINVYGCIDPLGLGLALFLTRPILSHPAGHMKIASIIFTCTNIKLVQIIWHGIEKKSIIIILIHTKFTQSFIVANYLKPLVKRKRYFKSVNNTVIITKKANEYYNCNL